MFPDPIINGVLSTSSFLAPDFSYFEDLIGFCSLQEVFCDTLVEVVSF